MSYDSIKESYEKEQIYIVEIDTPRCVNVHGTSPCNATETGDDKCYNTLATCNDLANYNDTLVVSGTNLSFFEDSFTRFSGDWRDDFKIGDVVQATGFPNALINETKFTITAVRFTDIDVTPRLEGVNAGSASGRTVYKKNTYTYRHCSPRSPHPMCMNNHAPCVQNLDVTPAKIDPKGGIGARTSVSVSMRDFPSSDGYNIDPYLSDRTYNPLDKGLYWLKWRNRHENYENINVRVKSGYIRNNEFLEENFDTRYYVMASMSIGQGSASLKCKDPLQLVTNKKALAPQPSDGQLTASITNTALSFSVTSGTGSDYGTAPFYVKIRDEVILVNTRSGDTFTSVTRGQFNTTADEHDQDDTVQLCLHYDGSKTLDIVLSELLIDFAKMPAEYIPSAAWASEVSTYLTSNPNRLITTPTDVRVLMSQLSVEWPHQLYWNDRNNIIELNAIKIKPSNASYNKLTGESNIMELSQRDRPDMQLSTVFVKYAQYDPTKKSDEPENYKVSYGRVNTDAVARYGSDNSRTIDALWIVSANGAQARKVAQLWGRRFGFMPRQIDFVLEDKDGGAWLGDIRTINHHDIVDQNGNPKDTDFEILSASEQKGFSYNALEYTFSDFIAGVDDDVTQQVIDLSLDENNINLYEKYNSVFGAPDSSTEAKFIVFGGVVIGSDSTSDHAVITDDGVTTWPAGATITLEVRAGAVICGKGGDGRTSTSGNNGGPCINLTYDLELINNGEVGGGGGGGGGATAASIGTASGAGAAGFGGTDTTTNQPSATIFTTATSGSATQSGERSRVEDNADPLLFIAGGLAGVLGQNGSSGVDSTGTGSTFAGGFSGKACDLNGNTLTVTGNSVKGTVS